MLSCSIYNALDNHILWLLDQCNDNRLLIFYLRFTMFLQIAIFIESHEIKVLLNTAYLSSSHKQLNVYYLLFLLFNFKNLCFKTFIKIVIIVIILNQLQFFYHTVYFNPTLSSFFTTWHTHSFSFHISPYFLYETNFFLRTVCVRHG